MDSTTHIAGSYITIGERMIQRCAWCGQKLIDTRGQMAPVGPDGEPPRACHWPAGRLVRVTHGNPERWELLPDSEQLPPDNCEELVE